MGDQKVDKFFLPEGSRFYVTLKSLKKFSGLKKLKQIYPSMQKYTGFYINFDHTLRNKAKTAPKS